MNASNKSQYWHKVDYCPNCKAKLQAALCPLEPHLKPSSGDLTICFTCGEPAIFNESLNMEKVNVGELPLELAQDIHKMQIMWKQYKKD